MTQLECSTTTTLDARSAAEVYYDGACPLCAGEIELYRRIVSGDVAWTDASAVGAMVAPDLAREDALARLHVRRADGRLVSGAAAFIAVWRKIQWVRPVAIALDRQPFLWVAERFYRGFLILRRLCRRTGT